MIMGGLFKKAMANKKVKTLLIVIPLIVMFFVCSGIVVSQLPDINRLKNQDVAYAAELEEQEKENAELQEILDSEDKDSYIQQRAREKGYVKSDEIVFYDIAGSN